MLCPVCGTYADDDSIVCSRCGKLLERSMPEVEEEELMKFRQGRHLRASQPEPPEEETPVRTGRSRAFEDPQPPVTPESTGAAYAQREALSSTGKYYGFDEDSEDKDESRRYMPPAVRQEYARKPRVKQHMYLRRMVNWAYVLIGVFMLIITAFVLTVLYLRSTEGQPFVARMAKPTVNEEGLMTLSWMGIEPSSAAIWQVGADYFNNGDVDKAIQYFEIARGLDEAAEAPNRTGLLLLGEAYEARGDLEAAREVYEYVYTEVAPSEQEAYRAQVRVLLELGRDAEAAALLQTAYQQTGVASFRSQRSELLPPPPTVDVAGGYYLETKTLRLEQAQEHDIVYSFNFYAELPQDGTLYTGPIELGEGEYRLRAVAVNGDLVSDPLDISYQIYMPTPLAPSANLAPGEYKSARKVTLKPGKLSDEDLEKNPGYASTLDDPVAQTIRIYYTIDGSMPDGDSPMYTGEPIVMNTNGYNLLRAVAVNGYNKQGNMKEVEIKLVLKTKAKAVYCTEDVIDNLKVGGTTREAFVSLYGPQQSTETIWLPGIDGECERYTYPWGYATFMKQKSGWLLAEVYLTANELKAPRSTRVGMTEKEIVSQYKDFGQVASESGNRGLYEDKKDKGKIYVQEDGGKIIRYRTGTEDAHVWQLDYILNKDGIVEAIHWLYER